jgi:glycosyltransferase involved in cell wall biosynthesis
MPNHSKLRPMVSVILPTYNRRESLLRTLDSFIGQTLDAILFEVIVVDDGGEDGTELAIKSGEFPFALRYVRQRNQGDAAARNTGAQESEASYLVFVDDDIALEPDCLEGFWRHLHEDTRLIVLGHLQTAFSADSRAPLSSTLELAFPVGQESDEGVVPFTHCLSGFMAVNRTSYFEIGGMSGLVPGGANSWCDVDFAYRAHKLGYSFYRTAAARAYHYDQTKQDFDRRCRQMEKVGRQGVLLLKKHPALVEHVGSLRDKQPICWRKDSFQLIFDKLFHNVTARRIPVRSMKTLIVLLEHRRPRSTLLMRLYRWTLSAYLFRGYRRGQREFRT